MKYCYSLIFSTITLPQNINHCYDRSDIFFQIQLFKVILEFAVKTKKERFPLAIFLVISIALHIIN